MEKIVPFVKQIKRLRETARVLCDVDAYPTDLTYFWTINDTKLLLNQKYPVNSKGLRSSLLFTAFTRFDYGVLRCWAENAAGQQTQACLFSVIPAGSPEGVKNCEVHETSVNSISIACDAGYDGGLQQIFHVEVYREESNGQVLIHNVTNSSPSFSVNQLQPSTEFVFQVYSSNIKGTSSARVRLKAHTSAAITSSSGRFVRVSHYFLFDTHKKRCTVIKLSEFRLPPFRNM
ncbi:Fibronectin type III domain containing protein 4-like protein [Leptotrombidium deliense]|uniref:Fibronectin type III domain containing protein 4-like protein n=1 Tax=Leptotrombidium deliense TaxID=299467 RepID=A0A443SW21_9ACAR|nr:Fibronectin type III domain containing protein 4-like protein [Leptotrombidium deliense]